MTTAFFNDHIIVDMDAGTSAQIKRLRSNDLAAMAALEHATHGSLDGGGGVGGGCIAPSALETSSNHSMSSPLPLEYVNNSGNIFQQQAAAAAVAAMAAGQNGFGGDRVGTSCNATSVAFMHHFQQNMQSLLRPSLVDLACTYFARPQPMYPQPQHAAYVATQQHEALVAAGLTAQQPLPPTAPVPPPLLLPPLPQHLSLNAGGSDGGGSGELLPNRVTAINSNTTSDCITNDADLSSSDSSLIQDDVTLPTATTPIPVPTTFDAVATANNTDSTIAAGSDGCPPTNDALPQSPSCNRAQLNHPSHNSNNGRKQGFSISAILGGGS